MQTELEGEMEADVNRYAPEQPPCQTPVGCLTHSQLARWLCGLEASLRSRYETAENRLSFCIDWMELANAYPLLADELLRNPKKFERNVCRHLGQLWKTFCANSSYTQLRCCIRPFNIPDHLIHRRQPTLEPNVIAKLRGRLIGAETAFPSLWARYGLFRSCSL